MAKLVGPTVLDAALTEIKTATIISFCSAVPANFAGIAAVKMAEVTGVTLAGALGNGTVAGGDANYYNRKFTVEAQNGMTILADGNVVCAVLHDGTDISHVAEPIGQPIAVLTGETWDSAAFDVEIEADLT